jgi:predicted enzyme related to lactoylglutathione lyase
MEDTILYPSWIEIPVVDLARATRFYCAVFSLAEVQTHRASEPAGTLDVVVLSPSDKSVQAPGVSLVKSARHQPSAGGVQVNFHVGTQAHLARAVEVAIQHGGSVVSPMVNAGEGVHYAILQDLEGNTIALSGYDDSE